MNLKTTIKKKNKKGKCYGFEAEKKKLMMSIEKYTQMKFPNCLFAQ